MREQDLFDERSETRTHTLTCPKCNQANEYEVVWLVRRKKARLPGHADERARAQFAKAQSYMLRRDDMLACKNIRCRKRFEIEGLQSIAFMQDTPDAPVDDRAARIRAAFGRRAAS